MSDRERPVVYQEEVCSSSYVSLLSIFGRFHSVSLSAFEVSIVVQLIFLAVTVAVAAVTAIASSILSSRRGRDKRARGELFSKCQGYAEAHSTDLLLDVIGHLLDSIFRSLSGIVDVLLC